MSELKKAVMAALDGVALPAGGSLVGKDLIRALQVNDGAVRFVIEAPDAESAQAIAPLRAQAETVAPVVRTSSTSRTRRSRTRAAARFEMAKAPATFRRRARALSPP